MCRQVPQPESGFRGAPGSLRARARGGSGFQLKLGAHLKEAHRLPAGASNRAGERRGAEGGGCLRVNHGGLRGCKQRGGVVEAGRRRRDGEKWGNVSLPVMLAIRMPFQGRETTRSPCSITSSMVARAQGWVWPKSSLYPWDRGILRLGESSTSAMPRSWPHLSPTAEGRGECNASKRWEQNFGQAAGGWIQGFGTRKIMSTSS